VAEATLAAAGLITGAALFELLLGISILSIPNFTAASFSVVSAEDMNLLTHWAEAPTFVQELPTFWLDARNLAGLGGLAALLAILYFNGRRRSAT
jgi:hypothetical protein